jgi:hypothetical protein
MVASPGGADARQRRVTFVSVWFSLNCIVDQLRAADSPKQPRAGAQCPFFPSASRSRCLARSVASLGLRVHPLRCVSLRCNREPIDDALQLRPHHWRGDPGLLLNHRAERDDYAMIMRAFGCALAVASAFGVASPKNFFNCANSFFVGFGNEWNQRESRPESTSLTRSL